MPNKRIPDAVSGIDPTHVTPANMPPRVPSGLKPVTDEGKSQHSHEPTVVYSVNSLKAKPGTEASKSSEAPRPARGTVESREVGELHRQSSGRRARAITNDFATDQPKSESAGATQANPVAAETGSPGASSPADETKTAGETKTATEPHPAAQTHAAAETSLAQKIVPTRAVSAIRPRTRALLVRNLRGRLARLGSSAPTTPPMLEPVIRALVAMHPNDNYSVLVRAFEVAEKWHTGQNRKNGDPYITHPIAVATVLAELGYTSDLLSAAILHDVVEDTEYSLAQLEHDFGPDIALLVDGVTKLDKDEHGENANAETLRKMVIATQKDIRVLAIKLADRLHNARTWKYVSPESARKKAKETLEIYAPLAHRLGINKVKWELENRSFEAINPAMYREIEASVARKSPEREQYLAMIFEELGSDLRKHGLSFEISGRPKHFYSIYQKMVADGKAFDEVYDLIGVRVIVENVTDCYTVMGLAHVRYSPIVSRFKDYISAPKLNIYQSIHTTLYGPSGRLVEIQIRTRQMHERAEFGVAAHWRYKRDKGVSSVLDAQESAMPWIRGIMDWQNETSDPQEFLATLKHEANTDEIHVFTPKGKVVSLVNGSTPLDFAYAVHTEVGHRAMGARVNGTVVQLGSKLKPGDSVQILTRKGEDYGPSPSWINLVASTRAKHRIRQWFQRNRRDESIDKGKELLAKHLRKQSVSLRRLLAGDSLAQLATALHMTSVDDLYFAIGEGKVTGETVTKKLLELNGGTEGASDDLAEAVIPGMGMNTRKFRRTDKPQIRVEGIDGMSIKLAKCCTPVPGDPVEGFISRSQYVSIHHAECTNLTTLTEETRQRFVKVSWGQDNDTVYMVQIQVEALDRRALMADVTRCLAELHVNILNAEVITSRDRVAISRFTFEMASTQHLQHVLTAIRKLEGVYDVKRVTGNNRRETTRGL